MTYKIALISLGCAKNLVNSEQMLSLIDEAGYEIVDDPEEADAAIVNTCGFIDSAKMEAIDNILYLASLKETGKLKKIIVTGCFSQRYQDELFKEMPEIDALLGTGSYSEITRVLKESLEGAEKISHYGDIDAPVEEIDRIISTGAASAYLRIAEGCDNRCAYCVIPGLRGKFRSRTIENVVKEAENLASNGIRELIVVAQDITRFGTDNYGKRMLSELLRRLCAIEGVEWVRLHYLYPDEVDDELIKTIAEEDKILKYLDIPIQHINNAILKRMNRRGTGDEIRELFKKLRREIPGVVLRTSIIAGLPGEGEDEFNELCDFLREAKIERAGVFPFSPEEGTPAAEMEHPDEETANKRAELLNDIQDKIMEAYNESRIGQKVRVLCEGFDEDIGCARGRSFAESPDVDGQILLFGAEYEIDGFYDVIIRGELDGELCAEAEQ